MRFIPGLGDNGVYPQTRKKQEDSKASSPIALSQLDCHHCSSVDGYRAATVRHTDRFRRSAEPLRPVTKGNLMKRNKLMCVKLILWYTEFAFGVVTARRHPCPAETLAAMIH